LWTGTFETEPYEAAWASEAIFFIRALEASGIPDDVPACVQISPDGRHWCNEGSFVFLPTDPNAITFCRVSHFGGWLRLVGALPPGTQLKVLVYLVLKS